MIQTSANGSLERIPVLGWFFRRGKSNGKSVFVSYSSKDRALVEPLQAIIALSAGKVFYDHYSLVPGENWRLSIARSIKDCDLFLLFWSENASESEEVKKEFTAAFEANKKVVPILIDETPLMGRLTNLHGIWLGRAIEGREAGTYPELIVPFLRLNMMHEGIPYAGPIGGIPELRSRKVQKQIKKFNAEVYRRSALRSAAKN
jgi:hypothetical protein